MQKWLCHTSKLMHGVPKKCAFFILLCTCNYVIDCNSLRVVASPRLAQRLLLRMFWNSLDLTIYVSRLCEKCLFGLINNIVSHSCSHQFFWYLSACGQNQSHGPNYPNMHQDHMCLCRQGGKTHSRHNHK